MLSNLAYARFGTSFIASALLGRRSVSCLWELTYRCNARCVICGYWRRPSDPTQEMTLAQIEEGPDHVHGHGCRFVNFTGGEPTLRRDLEAIVHRASALGMWTSLVTNGAALTRQRVQSLKRAGLDSLMISMDSPDAATHDAIRGVPGLHRRVVDGLRLLFEEFLTGLRVGGLMCVLAPHNLEHLDQIVALADELGVYVLFQPYHARETRSREFSAEITPSHVEKIRRLHRRYGNVLNSSSYLTGIARFAAGAALPGCHAGRKYFSIDPFGYVHPCVDLPPAGHLLRDPLTVLRAASPRAAVAACDGCWYCFRGEADASLSARGWVDRIVLGARIARRNARSPEPPREPVVPDWSSAMDAANLIAQWGPAVATVAVAFVSAVVPFVYVEVYLLAAVALVPDGYATWTLGIVAAIGQMAGKSALYWSARGVTHSRVRPRGDMVNAGGLRHRMAAMTPLAVGGFTFASAFVGFPPLILVAPAAGAAAIRFWPFVIGGLVGRVLRFTALVLAATEAGRLIAARFVQ